MAESPSPRLLTASGESAVGQTLDLPPNGLQLVLRVPAVASAHLELTEASLTLEGPEGKTELKAGTSPGLVVTTNLGPLSEDWKREKAQDVSWLIVDWGARRSLVSLTVTPVLEGDPNIVRLKVSDGGVWFPAAPVESVPLGVEQPLPDLVASRMMLEVGRPEMGGVFKSTTDHFAGLTVTLAGQPSDLTVRVGAQPVLVRPGRLLPGQQVRVVDGLREALQPLLPNDGSAVDVPIVIQAALPGPVKVAGAEFPARTVYTSLDGGQEPLPLPWGGEAVGRVTVGAGARLEAMRFTVVPGLVPERFLLEGRPASATAFAQLCGSGHEAAQGFPGLGGLGLAGVDVLLRPLTKQVVGVLALHPDARGRPGDAPYTGARVPFSVSVKDEALREPRWVSVQLPGPLLLKEGWWLVLSVSQGEALWPLATTVPALAGGLGLVLHRRGAGAWLPWEPPPAPLPWALSRLRVSSQEPPPPFTVKLRRGQVERTVERVAGGGVVELPSDVLEALSKGDAANEATLEVAVCSAGEPVTGTVRLAGLRVAVRCGDTAGGTKEDTA